MLLTIEMAWLAIMLFSIWILSAIFCGISIYYRNKWNLKMVDDLTFSQIDRIINKMLKKNDIEYNNVEKIRTLRFLQNKSKVYYIKKSDLYIGIMEFGPHRLIALNRVNVERKVLIEKFQKKIDHEINEYVIN